MFRIHETCQQYVTRRLSEGWKIVRQKGHHLILSSPDGKILRPVDLRNDVETLRPNAPGTITELTSNDPPNWQCVDEASTDEDGTYAQPAAYNTIQKDTYNLPAHSASGVINSVKVYARSRSENKDVSYSFAATLLRTGGSNYQGTNYMDVAYATRSKTYANNPKTTTTWTWSDIDALQIGVVMRMYMDGTAHCTQVYVEVDYIPAPPAAVGFSHGYIIF